MNCDFYDQPVRANGVRRTLAMPFRRAVRKLQLPYYQRLRDLIVHLFHNRIEDRRVIESHAQRLAAMECALADQQAAAKAFALDYTAVTRRLAQLEDLLLAQQAIPETILPFDRYRAAA